ncbi:MAG: site-specific tyrosine recombinase XerD, partial [Gammaproteobacteria bacterium]
MEHGLSEQTLASYGSDLKQFSKWLSGKNICLLD